MRKLIFLFVIFSLAPAVAAQTKLFLRIGGSELGGIWTTAYTGYGCNALTGNLMRRVASTTAGSAFVDQTHIPSSTAPPCHSSNASLYPEWFSPPISSGVTISGNIDFNISCTESNNALNAGMRMIVYRWSARLGGIDATIITSADTTECAGTRLAIAAAAPTSTVMAVGDRIVCRVEIRNVGGAWGGNSSRSVTLKLDAASGSLGDTFINFADTLSFAADTNNGRAIISQDFGKFLPRALPRFTPAARNRIWAAATPRPGVVIP